MAIYEEVGVRAVVQGASTYVSDANRVNQSTAAMNREMRETAKAAREAASAEAHRIASIRQSAEAMNFASTRALALGVAMAAPGTAAITMAANFERAITQIVTLSGVGSGAIGTLTDGVLEISSRTAQGPQELARGLLAVTSTGIKGAEALEVLDAAAKASAIGLGDTQTIARTLTAAMTAFRSQNLSAAEAADILFATVRDGGAEVEGVAGALGRVVGIAATVGVSFEDVSAFISTFTRLGVSAEESVTALRGTLSLMINPSVEAKEQLEGVGLSMEALRKIAVEQGLNVALQTILEAFNGNEEAIADVIPNVRALAGILGTAGVQATVYADNLDKAKNATGDIDEAFAKVSATTAHKFDQAIANLQKSMIELGAVGLPAVNSLLAPITRLITAFGNLPEPVQKAILYTSLLGGAALITVGSLGLIVGSVVRLSVDLPLLATAIRGVASAMAGANLAFLASPVGLAAIAVAALAAGAAYLFLRDRAIEARREAAESAQVQSISATSTVAGITESIRVTREYRDSLQEERSALKATVDASNGMSDSTIRNVAALVNVEASIDHVNNELDVQNRALALATARENATAAAADAVANAMNGAGGAIRNFGVGLDQINAKAIASAYALDILNEQLYIASGAAGPSAAGFLMDQAIEKAKTAIGLSKEFDAILEGILAGAGAAPGEYGRAAIQQATKPVLTEMEKAAEEYERRLEAAWKRIGDSFNKDRVGAIAGGGTESLDQVQARQQGLLESTQTLAEKIRQALGVDVPTSLELAFEHVSQAAQDFAANATRIAEEAVRNAERFAQEAAAAQRRIYQEAIEQINTLGDLVMSALRAEAQAALDAAIATTDRLRKAYESAATARMEAIEAARDAEIEAAEDSRDARIAAIEAATEATIDGLNAQIAALQDVASAEDRASLVRDVRLAFDPTERAQAEKALRDFDRKETIDSIQARISAVQEGASEEIAIENDRTDRAIEGINERADAQAAALDVERQAQLAHFDALVTSARAAYDAQTNEFALAAEARKLIADGEQADIIRLLESYAPQWQTVGLSFGEQLVQGIRSKVQPFVSGLLANVPGTGKAGAGGPSLATDQRNDEISGLQTQGRTMKDAGVPEFALGPLRETLLNLGAIPEFKNGLDMGMVRRPILAALDPGEIVLNADQQRGLGTTFARGAFEGMFSGAQFSGSPEDNARAVRREFDSMMGRQLGREAFINGAG